MEKKVKNLDESLVFKLKELRNKQSELILNIGQLHLELKEMNNLMETMEKDYQIVSKEFRQELEVLEQNYPNGEIDLVEGTVTF